MTAEHNDGHEAVDRAERVWILLSALLIALFVGLVFYAVAMHGQHIAHAPARQPPERILQTAEFENPGVWRDDSGQLHASIVAQAFSFAPGEIEVPIGEEVVFRLTSRDVIHGFQIHNTTVNVELIPGEVAELRYTFSRPGRYPIICNQYCGLAHQNMIAHVRAVDPQAVDEPPDADAVPEPDAMAAGEAVYRAECLVCHQADGSGMPGVFPPLNLHMPRLLAADGGREYLIDVMLYGLVGEIRIDGQVYRGAMPPLARLNDQAIADVLNYSLHAWDNAPLTADAPAYEADEVAARRGRGLSPADMLGARNELALD